MSENVFDKHKCPLCGNIVVLDLKQNHDATSYSTTHVTGHCTGCGAEFEAEFFNNSGNGELIYKAICTEPRGVTEMNILGRTGRT